jgi:hypothetical protein
MTFCSSLGGGFALLTRRDRIFLSTGNLALVPDNSVGPTRVANDPRRDDRHRRLRLLRTPRAAVPKLCAMKHSSDDSQPDRKDVALPPTPLPRGADPREPAPRARSGPTGNGFANAGTRGTASGAPIAADVRRNHATATNPEDVACDVAAPACCAGPGDAITLKPRSSPSPARITDSREEGNSSHLASR